MADKTNGSPAKKDAGSMSKKDTVRRALQDLGNEARPMQIRDHIKQRYNMEMGLDHISTVKGEILRESGQAKPAAAKPPAKQAPASKPAASAEQTRKTAPAQLSETPGISLKDIETVKDLVERVGASSLKKLIEVMAR